MSIVGALMGGGGSQFAKGQLMSVNEDGLLVMANPIQPVSGNDIFESARQQDEERRRREAQEHYERTGERLPEYHEYDPLVPINGREPPDVANDGDSYDERNRRSRRQDDSINEVDLIRTFNETFQDATRLRRENAIKAQIEEEQRIREEKRKKYDTLQEQSNQKFKSAISGLEIEENEE